MDLDEFLEQFVEGYLFGDLETMSQCVLPEGKKFGAVGYPMLATSLAGMELLGNLSMPDRSEFNKNAGRAYFLNFWDNYFVKQNPVYEGLGPLFYSLIRHGIAHSFVAKHGIAVHKFSGHKTVIDLENQTILVDPNVFLTEFSETYQILVKPALGGSNASGVSKSTAQARLNSMAASYSQDSKDLFNELAELKSAKSSSSDPLLRGTPLSSGASLAMGPIDELPVISTKSVNASHVNASTTTLPPPSGTLPSKDE